MTHEERLELINRPLGIFTHGTTYPHAGCIVGDHFAPSVADVDEQLDLEDLRAYVRHVYGPEIENLVWNTRAVRTPSGRMYGRERAAAVSVEVAECINEGLTVRSAASRIHRSLQGGKAAA